MTQGNLGRGSQHVASLPEETFRATAPAVDVWWRVVGGLLLLSLAALTLIPFGTLLSSAFSITGRPSVTDFTFDNVVVALLQPRTYGLVLNSLVFSVGSLVVAAFFALPAAWFIERTDATHKSIMRLLVLSAIGMPGLLMAIGWMLLASPSIGLLNGALGPLGVLNVYSLWGMMLVQGLSFVPVLFLMVSPAMRNMNGAYEEAALMAGAGNWRTFARITLPLIWPAVLPAFGFIFVVGMLSFDIPATLGIPANFYVLSSEIYFATSAYSVPQLGYASALSLLIMCLGLLSIAFESSATFRSGRSSATVTGKLRTSRLSLGSARYWGYAWIGLYFTLAVLLPFGALGVASLEDYIAPIYRLSVDQLSFGNYERLWSDPIAMRSLVNTLVVAASAATIVTVYAALIAWVVVRSPLRWRWALGALAFLPVLIPGIAIGLALRSIALAAPMLGLYGTLIVIILACVIEALPFSVRVLNGALLQVHPELEEAATMSQASRADTLRRVLLPLVLPALAFVWLWIFLRSLREFSAAVMLYTPKTQVASTLVYRAFAEGDLTMAATVGMAFLVVVLPVTVAVLTWLDRSRTKVGLA